jgi:hypothetical protein
VRRGRVILHGDVASDTQRDAAGSAVRRLAGVRVVDNLLEVESVAQPVAAHVDRQPSMESARLVDPELPVFLRP